MAQSWGEKISEEKRRTWAAAEALRKRHLLSREKLAALAGVSVNTVNKAANPKRLRGCRCRTIDRMLHAMKAYEREHTVRR